MIDNKEKFIKIFRINQKSKEIVNELNKAPKGTDYYIINMLPIKAIKAILISDKQQEKIFALDDFSKKEIKELIPIIYSLLK